MEKYHFYLFKKIPYIVTHIVISSFYHYLSFFHLLRSLYNFFFFLNTFPNSLQWSHIQSGIFDYGVKNWWVHNLEHLNLANKGSATVEIIFSLQFPSLYCQLCQYNNHQGYITTFQIPLQSQEMLNSENITIVFHVIFCIFYFAIFWFYRFFQFLYFYLFLLKTKSCYDQNIHCDYSHESAKY